MRLGCHTVGEKNGKKGRLNFLKFTTVENNFANRFASNNRN